MSRTKEFELNTDIPQFEAWLDEYLSRPINTKFTNEIGDEFLVVKDYTLVSGNQVRRNYEIQGIRIEKEHPGKDIHFLGSTYNIKFIDLDLIKWADNRLIVNIACVHPALAPYVETMLDEIARRWPEELPKNGESAEEKLKRKFENLKDETQERKREMWEIMRVVDAEYVVLALDKRINNPKPRMEDYRDRIIDTMGPGVKGTCTRSLSEIRAFGKAGLMN